jgi:hypothetical protein
MKDDTRVYDESICLGGGVSTRHAINEATMVKSQYIVRLIYSQWVSLTTQQLHTVIVADIVLVI